jgi:hypothetical protein
MTTKDRTCAERIEENYLSRCVTVGALMNAYDPSNLNEDDEDEMEMLKEIQSEDYNEDSIHEFPLSIEKFVTMKIQFSTGGPADWIEFEMNDRGIYDVRYYFQDWFDVASMNVSRDSWLYEYAQHCAELYDN